MSYEFYKVLHVFSALLLFTSLGTLAASARSDSGQLKKLAGIAHGVALAVIFVAGFGLMARLGMFGAIPVWAWLKIGLWLISRSGRASPAPQTRMGDRVVARHSAAWAGWPRGSRSRNRSDRLASCAASQRHER